MSDIVVDARGHRCPVPSLRLRKAMAAQPAGARLVLLASDPMARIDIPHLLAQTGGRLVSVEDQADGLRFTVETGAAPSG